MLSELQSSLAEDYWDDVFDVVTLNDQLLSVNELLLPVIDYARTALTEQQQRVMAYIFWRFTFLKNVIANFFGIDELPAPLSDEDESSYFWQPLSQVKEAFRSIDFGDQSVALTAKINLDFDSVVRELLKNPPGEKTLESDIFNEKALLTSFGTKSKGRGSVTYNTLVARLGNVLCYHFRSIITPDEEE